MLKLSRSAKPAHPPKLAPVRLGEAEAGRLEQRIPYSAVLPMRERLGLGDRCYAIQDEAGENKSFLWVASRRAVYIYELREKVWVPENVAYLYDAFTFPEARGRGFIGELVRGVLVDLRDSPVERCEAWISRGNRASLKAFEKAGFRIYGSWLLAAVGPLRLLKGDPAIGGRVAPPDMMLASANEGVRVELTRSGSAMRACS